VPTTTILLADDNSAVLEHVTKLLKANYDVIGAVNDGASVLRECSSTEPAVIVLDISMGDMSGMDVARRLRESGCNSKIIFLTVHEDPDFVNAAMSAGGLAYVVKSRLRMDLVSAIKAVLSNELFVSPNLLYERIKK
jgi:DNA-binding NarL/FixJ family response regulator